MATNYWCCSSIIVVLLFLVRLNLEAATKQNEDFFQFENNSLDISILKSKNENFLIYRNTGKKECYIERVSVKNSEDEQHSRTLYVGQEQLKNSDKVYTELDDDTKNFCNQFSLFVLQEEPPTHITKSKHVRKRRRAHRPEQSHYKSQTRTQYIFFNGGPSRRGKIYIQQDNFENQSHLKNGYDGFMTVTKSETEESHNKDVLLIKKSI